MESFTINEFKNDLRLVIDQNPHPIKFVINYSNPQTQKEKFDTKKEFGLRLLQILEDPETDNVDVYIVKTKGYIGYVSKMANICDWYRFSTTREKSSKPVITKNIEELQILVTTKADAARIAERLQNMSKDKHFYKHE